MAGESEKRRKKVTGDATHRTGTLRAAVKPGVTVGRKSVSRVISDFIEAKGAGTLTQSVWGSALAASADALRKEFELPAGEELYLFTKLSSAGNRTAGILLSSSGFHLLDGKGSCGDVSWEQLPGCDILLNRGVLVIGKIGISSPDSAALAELLLTIKSTLS